MARAETVHDSWHHWICTDNDGACAASHHKSFAVLDGARPYRPGKTRRDHETGAWQHRFTNRQNDRGRNGATR